MRTAATGNYLATAAAAIRGVNRFSKCAPGGRNWWTDYRKARLTYIMDRWNDSEKAARVLGCSPGHCWGMWNSISEKQREAYRGSPNYR